MASTGAIYGSTCFSTPAAAVDAFYSASAPAFTAGATSYLNEFVKEAGVWKIKGFQIANNGTLSTRWTINAPVPTFQACDPEESFFDGVAIGWAIAGSLVVAVAFTLMKRATA